MSAFIQLPNLPLQCKAVLYGEKYAEKLKKRLELLQIESIIVPDNPFVDKRLTGHADLSVLHAGGERILLAPYLKGSAVSSYLQSLGAVLTYPQIRQSDIYPEDAQLNLCMIGKCVLYNINSVPDCIVEILTNCGDLCFQSCRQGYSRCAVCVVDEQSLITADRGIAAAAEALGMHVLRIAPGAVVLDGFPYGFIGGASFKISEKNLAFTGRLDGHPDCERILSFLREREIEPLFLTQEPIFDIGSAIPILEMG